jgi:uncharacterized cupredoxin-like copper-binding protein
MKKLGILMILLMLAGILSGCSRASSFTVVAGVENNTKRSMSMTYEKFDGKKMAEEPIHVAKGEEVVVKVDIVTEDGSITVYIAPESDPKDYVLESHDIATSQFTVTLSEEGDYLLRIEADDHKGSYSIDW